MQRLNPTFSAVFLVLVMAAGPAAAYIGPGMGAGAIAVVFGLIGSLFLAIVAVLYFPVKRLLRNRRKGETGETDGGRK